MASGEPQPQLPGLGDPSTGRSDASTMVTGGAGGDEEEEAMGAAGGPLGDIVLIGTPWGLLLSPKPLSSRKPEDEEVSDATCPENKMPAAAAREKRCVQCGATETPQWRMQPVGQGALCNACRILLRPAEVLREPVHVHVRLPPPATATPTTDIARREKSPSPAPVPAPEEKKQKRKRKPCHPRKSSSKPLQEQEDRPAPSPNLKLSAEQAGKHREHNQPPQPAAMQPRTGDELPTGVPFSLEHQLLLDAIDGSSPVTHNVYGVDGELQMADPSSLDEFLFNGPAAPMLIDDEEEDDLAH